MPVINAVRVNEFSDLFALMPGFATSHLNSTWDGFVASRDFTGSGPVDKIHIVPKMKGTPQPNAFSSPTRFIQNFPISKLELFGRQKFGAFEPS